MDEFWSDCLVRFEQELSSQQFNTWIKPLQITGSLTSPKLLAPNRFVLQWVKDRFLDRIQQVATEILNSEVIIELGLGTNSQKQKNVSQGDIAGSPNKISSANPSVNKDNTTKPTIALNEVENTVNAISDKKTEKTSKKSKQSTDTSGLNIQFSFDNFVTGRANQLARAAAIQVAENPGVSYNPLFIYGGVGLGKTHLMQAIGNHLKLEKPEAKIRYLHAERYVSDVIKAYENKAFDDFKRQYHSLDMLLIDDIQFFAKKSRTQEEFFYAFNALIEAKKQIVITCDTYPKEIEDVDERLRTRFSWGLTVAVEPPELEMRVAILLKKAQEAKFNLPEDAAFFVGKQIRSNVRELEGALNRIIAMSNFTGHAADVHLAKDALRDLLAVRGRQVTIENIQKTVADYYKIKVAEMYSKKRTRNYARPRQIAMALSRELTNHSFPEIGEAFGGRHHTTVMHACEEVDQMKLTDPVMTRDIAFLIQVIRD